MKPITEEQRKELIEFINAAMESMRGNEPVDQSRFNIEKLTPMVTEIALASLMAKPIGAAIGEKSFALTGKMVGGDSVYTAPPVPVIKFPEFISNSQYGVGEYTSGRVCGYNECLTEIKRLNGLGE